ncbi:hypothetical protein AVEN_259484-1 [Araneus ventricosus]|uniref:Uncharacterized protein n=1 Tax=Araneus ventricosus TaxID=182803 RepID=A0A4Y2P2V3_ARAVE|nr:hypothetical protein AVEN_259484-1 [Araneus ventricosus]
MKLRLQGVQLIAVIHHRDYYSQALTKGLLRMRNRYRGRYLTARLCKTPAKFQRSTKGMLLFNSTAYQKSWLSQGFGYSHGVNKTLISSKFRFRQPTPRSSTPCVYFSAIALPTL